MNETVYHPSDYSTPLIIVQARLGSVRFPKKIFAQILNKKSLDILLYRLRKINCHYDLIFAITEDKIDDDLALWCQVNKVEFYRGSDQNVLKRFYDSSQEKNNDVLIRITGDCPFIDSVVIEDCLKEFNLKKLDYLRTSLDFPDGLDVEVFSKKSLADAHFHAKSTFDIEHVTPFIMNSKNNRVGELESEFHMSQIRITLDEPIDLVVLNSIAEYFGHFDFSIRDLDYLSKLKPEIFEHNAKIERDEGSKMSSGEKLWTRAQNVIAGGNMLLSKRPDMFLQKGWPTYFSKTSGCYVWDLDNVKYTDISLMGVGTNILGYSHPKVDEAVEKVVRDGNLSTLNAPEEVYLAEKLISIHPWASKVRFARTGGEANAVAIRLARAATGRNKIAFCGYHGWHDWYLSANLNNQNNLNEHLLPGLKYAGVPTELTNTSKPFHFNNLDEFKEVLNDNDLAAVVMEVMRNQEPEPGFLEAIREMTSKKGIVLIFDECTSGFRETFGGLHLKYGVSPDIATFGKTLGNGYAITAVLGIDEIMKSIDKTFISSTFWTERIGSAAALATLDVMENEKIQNQIIQTSTQLREGLMEISQANNLKIQFFGLPSLTRFSLEGFEDRLVKTFITREMLNLFYLASNSIYVSMAHDKKIRDLYFEDINKIFARISNMSNLDLASRVEKDIATDGFMRLN
jgi:glutamate-1-semialdehyde 2,1-aminomutase